MEFVLKYIRWIKGLSSRSSKIGPVKSYFRKYEYQINDIIFEDPQKKYRLGTVNKVFYLRA